MESPLTPKPTGSVGCSQADRDWAVWLVGWGGRCNTGTGLCTPPPAHHNDMPKDPSSLHSLSTKLYKQHHPERKRRIEKELVFSHVYIPFWEADFARSCSLFATKRAVSAETAAPPPSCSADRGRKAGSDLLIEGLWPVETQFV